MDSCKCSSWYYESIERYTYKTVFQLTFLIIISVCHSAAILGSPHPQIHERNTTKHARNCTNESRRRIRFCPYTTHQWTGGGSSPASILRNSWNPYLWAVCTFHKFLEKGSSIPPTQEAVNNPLGYVSISSSCRCLGWWYKGVIVFCVYDSMILISLSILHRCVWDWNLNVRLTGALCSLLLDRIWKTNTQTSLALTFELYIDAFYLQNT